MTKILSTATLLVVGISAFTIAAPELGRLAHSLVPLVLVVGAVAAVLRVVWFLTR